MALFIQQIDFTQRQTIHRWLTHIQNMILPKTLLIISALVGMISLTACQSLPTAPATSIQIVTTSTTTTTIQEPAVDDLNDVDGYMDSSIDNTDDSIDSVDSYEDDSDYSIAPYVPSQSITATDTTIEPTPSSVSSDDNEVFVLDDEVTTSTPIQQPAPIPKLPSRDELLKQARQNSKQPTRQTASSSTDLPAFRNLMQLGVNQLKNQQLTAAENSFTRAQRLAPRSSAVYFYLSQVAIKKNQPRKAEAMARRGLNVSQNASRRRALWQIILQSGQMQKNQRVVREAQQALR